MNDAGAARTLGYISEATGRKGNDRLWRLAYADHFGPTRLLAGRTTQIRTGQCSANEMTRTNGGKRHQLGRKTMDFQWSAATPRRSGRGGRRFKSCRSDQHLAANRASPHDLPTRPFT